MSRCGRVRYARGVEIQLCQSSEGQIWLHLFRHELSSASWPVSPSTPLCKCGCVGVCVGVYVYEREGGGEREGDREKGREWEEGRERENHLPSLQHDRKVTKNKYTKNHI